MYGLCIHVKPPHMRMHPLTTPCLGDTTCCRMLPDSWSKLATLEVLVSFSTKLQVGTSGPSACLRRWCTLFTPQHPALVAVV